MAELVKNPPDFQKEEMKEKTPPKSQDSSRKHQKLKKDQEKRSSNMHPTLIREENQKKKQEARPSLQKTVDVHTTLPPYYRERQTRQKPESLHGKPST